MQSKPPPVRSLIHHRFPFPFLSPSISFAITAPQATPSMARVTPMRTEIITRATRTQNVLGEKGRRIRELTSIVQKRFKFPENTVDLYAEKVNNRGLCAIAQCEYLRYMLLGGLAIRRGLRFKGEVLLNTNQAQLK